MGRRTGWDCSTRTLASLLWCDSRAYLSGRLSSHLELLTLIATHPCSTIFVVLTCGTLEKLVWPFLHLLTGEINPVK